MTRRKAPVVEPPEPDAEEEAPAVSEDEAAAKVDAESPRELTVNAECMHTSGIRGVAQCVMDGAPVGKPIHGLWVSAGALKYATPTTAAVKRAGGGAQVEHLTLGTGQARISVGPAALSPDMDAVLFGLSEPITLAKGDKLTVRWENKSGKRCGHYVACATKG